MSGADAIQNLEHRIELARDAKAVSESLAASEPAVRESAERLTADLVLEIADLEAEMVELQERMR
jgi:hypothetical protein